MTWAFKASAIFTILSILDFESPLSGAVMESTGTSKASESHFKYFSSKVS